MLFHFIDDVYILALFVCISHRLCYHSRIFRRLH